MTPTGRTLAVAGFLATGLGVASLAWAAGEGSGGRYTMSPADGGGFVRLDTETGAMSLCRGREGQWACTDMADDRSTRDELQRLRDENRALKTEVRRLEEILLPENGPKAERPGKLELPSEEDVDKAMTYFGRMIRKFREKLKELESDGRGTPL